MKPLLGSRKKRTCARTRAETLAHSFSFDCLAGTGCRSFPRLFSGRKGKKRWIKPSRAEKNRKKKRNRKKGPHCLF